VVPQNGKRKLFPFWVCCSWRIAALPTLGKENSLHLDRLLLMLRMQEKKKRLRNE
jgi:hypothetical protein